MANSVGDDSNSISEKSDINIFNRNDNLAVANSEVEIIDVNKFKTEVAALKMFVTKQLYIIKQSVGSHKTFVCNCSSKIDKYIDSLHDETNYLRQENKMKNSFNQSLLCQSPSKNVNDKGDHSSPISKEAENDNLDNLFDKVVHDSFVYAKENDHEKVVDSSKPLEHKNVTTRKKKKRKKKNHSEELDNRDNNYNNKHDKNSNNDRIDNNNRSTSSSNSKETVFILGDSMVNKVNGKNHLKNIKHKFLVKVRPLSSVKTRYMY